MLRMFGTILSVPAFIAATALGDADWAGNGSDNNWTTSDNWTSSPPTGKVRIIQSGAEVDVTTAINNWPSSLYVGAASGVTLNLLPGASLQVSSGMHAGYDETNPVDATINHTGGLLSVGQFNVRGGTVTYNFGGASATAPTFNSNNGIHFSNSGGSVDGELVLAMSGYGTVTSPSGMQFGNGKASATGSNTWSLVGGNLSINLGSYLTLKAPGSSTTTIVVTADGTGVSTINATNLYLDHQDRTYFQLDLAESFSAEVGDELVIFNITSGFFNNRRFANVADGGRIVDDSGYEFIASYDDGFRLTVDVIPEPASLALVAAGGMLILVRGRR